MNTNNQKRTRLSNLQKGKIKGIGPFEKIGLSFAGHIDGKRGLPRNSDSGWMSPRLAREMHAYAEYTSELWGALQIDQEENYARLGELMDSIEDTKKLLEDAKETLNAEAAKEKAVDLSRKTGESKLTDSQVAARRSRERAIKIAPFRSRVSTLEAALNTEIEDFRKLHRKLLEDNNSTRMICNKVKDHLQQRLAVYWNAAMRSHPDGQKMPETPQLDIPFFSEQMYLEPHKSLLMEKADLFSLKLLDIKHQEEVA